MRKILALLQVAAFVALGSSAHAALATPNGSFTVLIAGPNSTDTLCAGTPCIAAGTSVLNFSGLEFIGSFLDPFLGKPDNLSAAHAPGFLASGDIVTQSLETFPVGPIGVPSAVSDIVTACHGTSCVAFDFTSIHTATLTAATGTSSGTLTLDLIGTFSSDSTGSFALGQSADMAISCTQTTSAAAIVCGKSIDTPAILIPTPEPASTALLGSALIGLGWIRRRRRTA